MAAYAQFGYGYPSANQLIGGVSQNSAGIPTVSAVGNTSTSGGSVPSPLSGTNDASLSPSGDSTTTGVTTTGPQSPGAISQSSNNAGSGAAVALSTSPGGSCAIGSGGGGGGAGGTSAPIAAAADNNNSATDNRSGETVSCCENGRPIMTDPVSGQTICSCQYDSARLTLSGYPGSSVGVYGGPYPSTDQNPYPSIGVDSSAFYSPLSNPYGMKDNTACSDMGAWTSTGLQPTTGYYSYDPTLAAYGYGPSYDLASRRKNATRESTSTLKAWLNEHKKNPYPTKGEKIMLAIITKMTLTQVSTWFANARRRLKKENKMTWEPKNKTEDDDDGMLSDDEKEKVGPGDSQKSPDMYGESGLSDEHHKDHNNQHVKSEHSKADKDDVPDGERQPENLVSMRGLSPYSASYAAHGGYNPYHHPHHHHHHQQQQHQQQHQAAVYYHPGYAGVQESNDYGIQKNPMSSDCGIPVPASKPKIWSLADTVACKTPPPTAYPGQNFYLQSQQQQQQLHHQQHQTQPQAPAQGLPVHQQASASAPAPPPPPPPHHPHQLLANSMMPQAVHSSPLSMMSSYAGGSPYSRIPTAYTEAMAMHVKAVSTNVTDDIQQQYQSQPPQQQQQQQQPRVGFSEIQPDTPPQTPPNMKLNVSNTSTNSSSNSNSSSSNNNGSLHAPQGAVSLAALAAVPTASMCYTNTTAAQLHFNGISGVGFMPGGISSRSEA